MNGFNLDSKDNADALPDLGNSYLHLKSILEFSGSLVIAVTRKWIVSYANGKALTSFPELKLGSPYWTCFPALSGTTAEKYQRDAMEARTEMQYEDWYAASGKWYKVTINPIEAGITVFLTEITDEKAFETKFAMDQMLREQRIEAFSYMAGGLAHEISNPLAIIQSWAADLESTASGKELLPSREVSLVCEKILKTTVRASNIIRGLKAFGRDGSHDPMEPASIYTILDQTLELQESRFARNRVEIQTDLQPDLPDITCREVQIGQILTNLLNNALDAIVQSDSVERWVRVTAFSSSSEICVEVSDSGPGIEEHHKEHLMRPFFTTKEVGLGLGIGLSLSRAIAQSHGGTLTLVPDCGTTCFSLCLPLRTNTPEQHSSAHSAEALHEVEQG